MKSLDQLKEEIKEEASENPEKFFATEVLKEKGFSRGQCKNCRLYFWSSDPEREICGEPECGDGYTFINDSPTEVELTHTESWELFQEFMDDRGYASIDRYPVVARWRDDVEFTGASIYCFQPYVVSGEAEPPADELIIPQPSLRFNDVDNVGITGRHYTNFTMIGQTCFQPPEKYDQDRYFRDMFEFAVEGLGIPEEKLILHEDSWGGGGNLGACMEFFVDGLELWNQVYMFYKQTPEGYEELDLKVLDMGMGHERITWISRGTETSYESVMPETLSKMKERTGLEIDQEVWEKFLPHSSELNIDEVDDIDEKWKEVAEKIDEDVDNLKDEIKPAAALYSIAEHSRALNFALADGKIPSNTGGGHNLRMIYRRAKDFIEKYNWELKMTEVARWNAEELEPMFPELLESIDEIQRILEVEAKKYEKAREKAEKKLSELESQPSVEKMIELYESHGVSPEMMEEAGFEVPEDFYMQIGEEDEAIQEVEEDFDLEGVSETEKLYYDRREPYRKDGKTENFDFKAEILEVIDDEWIVLDRTMFYPQGGGQMHDVGKINGFQVEDVQKQSGVVLHRAPDHDLEEGQSVKGVVNGEKRKQLTQHHSTTHMVNAAAREELGEHIYQAGANKTLEKARLDITHYEKPDRETLDEIEASVREIIEEDHEINVLEMEKSDAEQEHGFRIYQGGAPPGNTIRLIDIEDVDIEACGGTHLTQSSHAEEFVITGCKRIQDGVIRLEYKAGESAREFQREVEGRVKEVSKLLDAEIPDDTRNVQRSLCEVFSVEPEHLVDTVERFMREVDGFEEKIEKLSDFLGEDTQISKVRRETTLETAESLYSIRKDREKKVENLESQIEEFLEEELEKNDFEEVEAEVPTENVGLLIQVAQKLSSKHQACITLIGEKGAVSASQTDESAEEKLEKYSDSVQGGKEFAKAFDI
ncbi:alanine--tRNA ligase [Candidatus Nanohalobium constans]|uniref:Alanine--tRNA ligase n=1 Tax=Candidatus Nanohalobium constans TaxID=2565781 RepID=A0A5Q0UEK9_9ARCH|nr:alanine--tRNA ligase [Candidatus Nanohalobium constans]QGA80002.1 alanyl-tRNA synthetase [Candidatus Nanohalobium constans]